MPYKPRATLDNPYGPLVTFRTEDVLPPPAYYISPEDQVTVCVLTDEPGQTIFIHLRQLMPTGEVKLIPYQFVVTGLYNFYVAYEIPPWEGYILGVLCWSTNTQLGRSYVSVQVTRNNPPDINQAGVVLLQGYVNGISVLSYPTGGLNYPFEGRGAFLTITQPNQTGVNVGWSSPQHTLYRVWSAMFTLSTSAAAGSRIVTMTKHDASGVQTGAWPAPISQAPSTVTVYTFAPGTPNGQQGPYVTIGAPTEVLMPAGSTLQTFVQGLDAADTVTSIAASIEEWVG